MTRFERPARSPRPRACSLPATGRCSPAAPTSIRRTSAGRSPGRCSTSRASTACAASAATTRGWTIGATTTWSDVLRADLPPLFDALKAAAREVGGVQIQNAGTVGRQPLQRIAGGRRHAGAARARRRASSCSSARGAARAAARATSCSAAGAPRGAADELVVARCAFRRAANGRARRFVKLGGRRYLMISITMVAVVVERRRRTAPIAHARRRGRQLLGRWRSACRRSRRACVGAPAAATSPACVEPADLAPLTPIDDLRAQRAPTASTRRADAAAPGACESVCATP